MSKQDNNSTQSLPVDENEPNTSQVQSGSEEATDSAVQENGSTVTSDPASVDQTSTTEASNNAAQGQTPSAAPSAESAAAESAAAESLTTSTAGSGASATASTSGTAAGGAAGATAAAGISASTIAIIVAAVAVIAAIVIGVVVVQQNASTGEDGNWFDSGAKQGQFEGKSKEEIQAALNEEVKKGMMNISIAAMVNFPAGSSEGEARIENIAANPMDQKVVITLKDSGDVVYESGAIAPDQHIQTITLNKTLAPGDHAAVATFTGYDRETHKETGKAAAEIVLHVEG